MSVQATYGGQTFSVMQQPKGALPKLKPGDGRLRADPVPYSDKTVFQWGGKGAPSLNLLAVGGHAFAEAMDALRTGATRDLVYHDFGGGTITHHNMILETVGDPYWFVEGYGGVAVEVVPLGWKQAG